MAAGYSASPQSKKLGLKPGMLVLIDGAPSGWRLDEEPDGLRSATDEPSVEFALAFVREASGFRERLIDLGERIFPAGMLWIAWPRKAAGHVSDVTEKMIRDTALELGMVDVKVAAISEDWSALKIVWRVENRTREA